MASRCATWSATTSKHNQANGENNQDGDNHNNNWNHGVEGPTDDAEVNALRARQQRNMLATLLLSQGVPMLLAGDERNRTQRGNNNAYCQDNAISWLDWRLDDEAHALLQCTRALIQLRKRHPALHRRRFFQGRSIHGGHVHDIEWYGPDGLELSDDEWNEQLVGCLGMLLNGAVMDEWDERGQHLRDDLFLLLLNGEELEHPFTLPGAASDPPWEVLIDTAVAGDGALPPARPGDAYDLQGLSLALLRRPAV